MTGSIRLIGTIGFFVLLASISNAAGLPAFVQEEEGFNGTWMRNPDESDDPDEATRAAAEEIFNKATKGGRGIFTEDIQQIQKQLQSSIASFVQFADTLIIDDEGKEFLVDDGVGRVRIFYLDGKKHNRQSPDGAKFETLSTRQGNRIIVDQKIKGGGRIVETYALSEEGDRLILTVRLEAKRLKEPMTIRNVYDREI
jgi:hypothetical protein